MQLTNRPLITAGVVLASASVIVTAPVEAPSANVPVRAIQLTASFDPLAEWQQVIQQALANATDIWNHWSPAPFPALQQVLVNQVGYLEEILKNPSTIADIPTQIENNFNAAVNAAITPFTPVNPEPYIYPSLDTTPTAITLHTLNFPLLPITVPGKEGLLNILENGFGFSFGPPGFLGCPSGPLCVTVNIPVLEDLVGPQLAHELPPFLPFTGSPLSGVLWGTIGTLLSPALQFHDDITAISDALNSSTPDFATAFQDLVNMPANITGAFLNGFGTTDLETLLSDLGLPDLNTLLADLGIQEPSVETNPDLYLGGLLSPAGSLINGIGVEDTLGNCLIGCATFDFPATAVGPIASLVGLSQAIAEAIGWSGVGNPLDALLSLF